MLKSPSLKPNPTSPTGDMGLAILGAALCGFANAINQYGHMVINHHNVQLVFISPNTVKMCNIIGATSIMAAIICAFKKGKYDNLFEALNLKSLDKLPKVVKKTKTSTGFILEIKMPAGLCKADFEREKEAIEQYLRATVIFSFKKNLIMEVIKTKLKEYYSYKPVHYDEPLKVAIGYTCKGLFEIDIEQAPHIIIAGATGGGKSVMLRTLITSLIVDKTPDIIQLHLVDFQRVELSIFKRSDRVAGFYYKQKQFKELLYKMRAMSEKRIEDFERSGVVNIQQWNKKYKNNRLKYHVVIVDEFASLAEREYKDILQELKIRIAQDRKCGIHYILCSQRPSTDIISGSIKANIPVRICYQLPTEIDSRVVLDESGAENLRGKGHGIVKNTDLTEIQTMFLSEGEARKLIDFTATDEKAETEIRIKLKEHAKSRIGVF